MTIKYVNSSIEATKKICTLGFDNSNTILIYPSDGYLTVRYVFRELLPDKKNAKLLLSHATGLEWIKSAELLPVGAELTNKCYRMISYNPNTQIFIAYLKME